MAGSNDLALQGRWNVAARQIKRRTAHVLHARRELSRRCLATRGDENTDESVNWMTAHVVPDAFIAAPPCLCFQPSGQALPARHQERERMIGRPSTHPGRFASSEERSIARTGLFLPGACAR